MLVILLKEYIYAPSDRETEGVNEGDTTLSHLGFSWPLSTS